MYGFMELQDSLVCDVALYFADQICWILLLGLIKHIKILDRCETHGMKVAL